VSDRDPHLPTATPARSLRPVAAAFGLLMALLVALALLAISGFRELADANRWSIHTYRVLAATEGMRGAMAEMETAFRGFALSGEPRFLEGWSGGARDFDAHADSARRLLSDNARQEASLAQLRRLQAEWRAAQAARMPAAGSDSSTVAAARAQAAELVGFGARRVAADSVRALLAAMERSEFELLRTRADHARALETRTGWLVASGVILALLVAGGAGALALRRTAEMRSANLLLTAEAAERILARRAAERLARQNALLLNAAAEGIYGVDAHGYTTFVNPAAAAMLGYDADELPGRPYEATLLSSSTDGDPIRAALLSGVPQTVRDATFRRADGERFPVEFTCTPIVEEERMAGAVITFRDVTERREVDRMKDEFVSVVSHELRTPLTAIRGSLGLLAAGKAGEVPERGQRMLDIAVQNTDRLIRLINDILDLERIESGKVAMEARPVNAAELAHNAAEVMLPMAERAGVGLFVEAEAVRLLADSDRILQVLTNLISNAVKFSPPGGSVELRVEPAEGEARFRVADQGRGIPTDRLESIFERFQQVDSSDSRQKGGTGLGLAICRTIVTQHGGRIWAESEPGAGSTFHFTLPLAPPPASAPVHEAPRPEPAGATEIVAEDGRRRVLVVEDDEDLARVLSETFERRGVVTEVAGTGERAWAAARRRRPDAVVLDIALPDGDGYWLAERFREHEGLRGVPIVAYTALDPDEPGRERLRRAGVDVLTKSRIEPTELERRVLSLLDDGAAVPGSPPHDPPLPPS
jgi:PAS domain S-box-containing protein